MFRIGEFEIRTYGVLLALAFVIGLYLATKEAKRRKIDHTNLVNLFIFIMIGAGVGSRIGHIIVYWNDYGGDFLSMLKFWNGGASFFGGFLGAVLLAYAYTKIKKLNLWKYADILTPCVALGMFMVRIGCFLNWEDYGIASSLPWAVKVGSDFARHPTQIYLSLLGLVLFFVFSKLRYKKRFDGALFLLFIIIFSFFGFLIELIRDSPRFFGLTAPQMIEIVLVVVALILYIKFKKGISSSFLV